MAANLYNQQDRNIAKTWALMTAFLVIVIALGWVFSFYYESPVILYGAIIFSLLMNFFSYWHSDKIVLRIAGAKPVNREEHFDLYTVTENLAITAGLPMPRVYIIDEAVPNAFATGRNKEHAVVAVTTGLLERLDRTELEGVIAHELAHIGNRDILLQTVIVVLVGFITLLSDLFLRMSFYGGGGRNRSGGSGNGKAGAWIAVAGILLAILSPIVAMIIQLAVSRRREFLADSTGALLTRYPEGLARALEKISAASSGQKMKKANHATAHLYISSPFGDTNRKSRRSFFTKIFSTHPPIEERVAALRGIRVEDLQR